MLIKSMSEIWLRLLFSESDKTGLMVIAGEKFSRSQMHLNKIITFVIAFHIFLIKRLLNLVQFMNHINI
jgi:hypothetical protein